MGCLFGSVDLFYVFPVFGITSDKILDYSVSAEDEEMVYQAVEEMTVMGDNNQASFILHQILFQYVEGNYVKIVGRFVENEKIRLLLKNSQKIKASFFPSGQPRNGGVKHIVGE